MKTHPHAEAAYRVVPFDDGSFAVEVVIPDSHPAKVSPFPTEEAAEEWIAEHRRRVENQTQTGRGFRRAGGFRR